MWEDFVDKAQSRHPELARSQVKATLIPMRNMVIQSNLPFVAPTDEITDLEFASGETPKTHLHDSMHSDLNEEHSNEVMFDDEGTLIVSPNLFSSFPFSSNPSSSRLHLDFGLSSSSSEPVDE